MTGTINTGMSPNIRAEGGGQKGKRAHIGMGLKYNDLLVDRKSVGWGKSVNVGVYMGGGGIIKKKKKNEDN
jgi:hypothetical protein